MLKPIILDGIAPTYYLRNGVIVIAFELFTLLLETGIFYLIFRKELEKEKLNLCLAIILVSNAFSFVVCALIYTAFYGYEWLFISWGTTPLRDLFTFLGFISIVPAIALFIAHLLLREWE